MIPGAPVSAGTGVEAATTAYWCRSALIDGAVAARVRVSVADGRIVALAFGVEPVADDVVLHGLVLPGLANAHSHCFHRALRSRSEAGSGTFWTWREEMYRVASALDPDRYHRLARAVYGEMVAAGITVVGEFHYLHHRPDGRPHPEPRAMAEALLAAAGEVGIRITLLDTLYLHGGFDEGGGAEAGPAARAEAVHRPVSEQQRRFCDGAVDGWVERVDGYRPGPGVRIGAAIHSVRSVDEAAAGRLASWAAEREAVVHVHLSEQRAENDQCRGATGLTPTGLLDRAGALGPRAVAVHATHLTEEDLAVLARSGTGVCLCPSTEADLADGIGPSEALARAGVALSLGSDSHAVIDLLAEARSVELHQRLATNRRGVHPALDLLAMATVNGHRHLGWDDGGRIEVGARADLVAVSLDSVRTAGAGDRAVEAVVFAAGAADVTDVVIDGRHLVTDGGHRGLDVADELRSAIDDLAAAVERSEDL